MADKFIILCLICLILSIAMKETLPPTKFATFTPPDCFMCHVNRKSGAKSHDMTLNIETVISGKIVCKLQDM